MRKALRAVVAPLRIARGIQNKVLEALAMDKPVLASKATALTFGDHLPFGVSRCETSATSPVGAERRRQIRELSDVQRNRALVGMPLWSR